MAIGTTTHDTSRYASDCCYACALDGNLLVKSEPPCDAAVSTRAREISHRIHDFGQARISVVGTPVTARLLCSAVRSPIAIRARREDLARKMTQGALLHTPLTLLRGVTDPPVVPYAPLTLGEAWARALTIVSLLLLVVGVAAVVHDDDDGCGKAKKSIKFGVMHKQERIQETRAKPEEMGI